MEDLRQYLKSIDNNTFALIFLALFVLVGIVIYLSKKNLRKTGIRTTGEVLEMIKGSHGYAPLVEIILEDGKSFAATYDISVSISPYEKGQQLVIYYEKGNPANFYIERVIKQYLD